jgi:hypothetical protein
VSGLDREALKVLLNCPQNEITRAAVKVLVRKLAADYWLDF